MSIPTIRTHTRVTLDGRSKGMEHAFYTLQDFFTFSKGVVYILVIFSLIALAGFWNFLTERDED